MSVAISGLTELTASPASNDYFIILDVSDVTQAPTGTTKRISTANVFTSVVVSSSLQVGGSLQVTGAATVGSTLSVTGAVSAASYGTSGVTLMILSLSAFNYTLLNDPTGRHAIYLGDTTDPANYYDNTTHRFRDRSGAGNFATITTASASFAGDVVAGGSGSFSSNLTVIGAVNVGSSVTASSISVVNASVSGTLTLGSALSVPTISAGSLTVSGASSLNTATVSSTLNVTGATTLGTANVTTLNVSGTATIGTLSITSLSLTNLTVTNVATMSVAQTDGGTTASISNGGTVDITVPNGVTFFVLQPTTGTLPVNNGMWIVRRDTTGANNTLVTNLAGGASTPVTALNTTQVRVTNNLGSACVFNYGFLRIAV